MYKMQIFKKNVRVSLFLILLSCSYTKEKTLPIPEIKDGIAILSGKITNYNAIVRDYKTTLTLIVSYPVRAESASYQAITTLNEEGTFSFEVPMQCDYAIGYLRPEKNSYKGFSVCLTAGKETIINIFSEKTGQYEITYQTDSLGLTSNDLIQIDISLEKIK